MRDSVTCHLSASITNMECSQCGSENPTQANFCSACGTSIALLNCPQCETENVPGSRFCNACGQVLEGNRENSGLLSAHAERRILSVLFCDLVDSTTLVDSLDPELSRGIIRSFQSTSKRIIETQGGRIATYLGDGIVALFSSHEINAERAINAALMINREIEKATDSFTQAQQAIRVRCGIATGLAVVGDDVLGHSQLRLETAIGLPMNIAARIQTIADPGSIAVDKGSYEATRGLFQFESTGLHPLKGIEQKQQVWRVVAEKSISSRFVAHAAELTPMVDRIEILQHLVDHWEKSIDNNAQVVLFYGEAGVGKSRIAQELVDILSIENDYYHLEYQCSPYHTNTTLYPVVNRLKAVAGLIHGDSNADQLAKLEVLVRGSSQDLMQDMPAFIDLMALPPGENWSIPELDPDARKEWILDTLIHNMFSLAESGPLMITIEDVHWIDPTTLELITRVVHLIVGQPILLMMTSRPGYSKRLPMLPGLFTYEIDRLPEKYSLLLLDQLKGEIELPPKLQEAIVQRTEGIPFFIEELSKSLLEGMAHEEAGFTEVPYEDIVLPHTLQESLLSRLDRLPEASKSIAQIAAVIGRDFAFELLENVAQYEDKNLYSTLSPLLEAQIVIQHKSPPDAEFSFRHALYRDAAYEAILKSDLAKIHKRIANVFENEYPDVLRDNPGLLARHFSEGNDFKKATLYWLRAGQKASQKFAMIEARSHLEEALNCVEKCPDNKQWKSVHLELLIALGPVLMALEGSGSELTRNNYLQAVNLCTELPPSEMQFKALWGQWHTSMDYSRDEGLIWADRLQNLAEELNNPELELQAYHCQWATRFHYADHEDAKHYLLKGLSLYDTECHQHHASEFGGHDPRVCGLAFLAWVHWFLGEFNEAEEESNQCLAFADQLDHEGSTLHAIELNLLLAQYQRDSVKIRTLTERLEVQCKEIGLPEYDGKLACCRGIVLSSNGDINEAIHLLKTGMAQLEAVGTTEDMPVYTEYLAMTLGLANKHAEALGYLDRLIETLHEQKLRYWHAEIYRRKGKLLLELGEHEEALKFMLMSMQVAEEQNALALVLRSALCLHELNMRTHVYPEALQNLHAAHQRFNQEQSSPDLDKARDILARYH